MFLLQTNNVTILWFFSKSFAYGISCSFSYKNDHDLPVFSIRDMKLLILAVIPFDDPK